MQRFNNSFHALSANKQLIGQNAANLQRESIGASSVQMLHAPSLTTHVWPKSRMLFAIVSKMSKEGVLANDQQRGVLKDLILENDSKLMDCLAEYESQGDRQKLYQGFISIA